MYPLLYSSLDEKTSLAAISYGRDWLAEVLVYTEEYRLEYHKEGFMLEREEHRSRREAVYL
ncbi:hypothetical protein C173_12252 [Paenibacillus sp. FSL R7-277]|nr:hypothetical protein C173_12252 [Paenibacillus sp. FSL R7-277]